MTQDKHALTKILRQGGPFEAIPGRKIGIDFEPSIMERMDKLKLNNFLEQTACRATSHCVPDFDEDEDGM